MKVSKKKVAAIVATGAAITAASGIAFAFWSSSGSITGDSSTTNPPSDVIVVAQTTGASNLAPGHVAETLSGTVTNPSTAANKFYVDKVTAAITNVTLASGHAPGTCTAADYSLSIPAMSVQQDLGPGDSADFTGATLAFNDTAANQDACKGATVTITYTAS